MSPKVAELVQRVERGERVKKIRDALEMTGEQFAAQLNRLAQTCGLHATYDRSKVSRIESGTRTLTDEDVALITAIDPRKRSVAWLVVGEPRLGKRILPRGASEEGQKSG